MKPEMTKVESSNLQSVGYDTDKEELYVQFKNGATYVYSDVPKSVYDNLMDASSKGKFFIANVKASFDFRRL